MITFKAIFMGNKWEVHARIRDHNLIPRTVERYKEEYDSEAEAEKAIPLYEAIFYSKRQRLVKK